MDEGESVREGKQQREREKERERRGEDQWEPPRSGLPGCQASCGLFVTMQCDSNGDSVLGAMSLMMNSSTTIIPPPHPRPPTFRLSAYAHTHTCLCTKHRSLPTNTHTHSDSTSSPPQPLQHSATYIWCRRERAGAKVGPGRPAPSRQWGSVHVACDVCEWQRNLFMFLSRRTPPAWRWGTYRSVHNRTPAHEHTRADSKQALRLKNRL